MKSKRRDIPPIHPGEVLREEFLDPLGLSVYGLARAIGINRARLNDIVLGRRGISADTALRLARYFRTDAQSWMNLQTRYELDRAAAVLGDRLAKQIVPRAA